METSSRDLFSEERKQLNEILLKHSDKTSKRFLGLDNQVYNDGAVDCRTKEMMGLVASLVLRCDDCIKYHLIRCFEEAVSNEELDEIFSITLIVGGSITIPHIRRAAAFWDTLE